MDNFLKLYLGLFQNKDLDIQSIVLFSYLLYELEIIDEKGIEKAIEVSNSELAKKLNVDERIIRKLLKKLEEKEYIKIIKEKGKTNRFLINKKKYDMIINH